MKVVVHEAGLHDRAGAKLVLEKLRGRFPRMPRYGLTAPIGD